MAHPAGTVTFATMLKELRAKLGFSQQELAAALHVSRVVISRWERGTSEPVLGKLFAALGPHLLELLKPPPDAGGLEKWLSAQLPKRYTSAELRAAAAGEIINCMGLAKDALHPAIHEYGKTLVVRIPCILDALEDPHPPDPRLLQALLVLGRERLRQELPGYQIRKQ